MHIFVRNETKGSKKKLILIDGFLFLGRKQKNKTKFNKKNE